MRTNDSFPDRIPKLGMLRSNHPCNRVPVQMVDSNSKWKPIAELEVQNNILEGVHKIIKIPYEKPSCRKHQGL